MSLTNISFLGIYFPILLIIYYNPFFKNNTFRKIVLLCASLGLYAICEPVYVLLLLAVIVFNYLCVYLADKFSFDMFRGMAIVIDAVILLFFKYINALLGSKLINMDISPILFPIGLSYFAFKSISYVVDSKSVKERGSLIDVAIYISNFLTIVSGPLSTYEDELSSVKTKATPSFESAYTGFERIIIGLGKKVIIADSLQLLVQHCFASSGLSFVMAWVGAIAYALQLFFDFSGYTDMVLGLGILFGFKFPENFNYPYMATSISDFWKRWHISLTKWFTKYIYIPLGGSRVNSSVRHIFNLFVVWLVTGVWHGSNATFIVWAMIYFLLQVLEKYTNMAKFLNRIHVGRFYALFVIVINWVIFKSESLKSAYTYICSMFGVGKGDFCNTVDLEMIVRYTIPFVLGIVFSTDVGKKIIRLSDKNPALKTIYNITLLIILFVSISMMISQGYVAPLYAGF